METQPIVDCLLLHCIEVRIAHIKNSPLSIPEEDLKIMFLDLKELSEVTYLYVLDGFDLMFQCNLPEYTKVAMEHKLFQYFKEDVSTEEIRAMTLFKYILTDSLLVYDDGCLLHTICSVEMSRTYETAEALYRLDKMSPPTTSIYPPITVTYPIPLSSEE